MKNKWFLVVNPTAGHGKGRKSWKEVEKLLQQMDVAYDHVMSEHTGHIIEVTKAAIAKGYRKIAAVGGDGTAHEVVNGIFQQTEVDPQELIFAVIPVGTGNDWIRTHKIPNNFKKAILLMKAGKTILHDVGRIDYTTMDNQPAMRYFINAASIGYGAFAVHEAQNRSRWMGNTLFYLSVILSCITKYKTTRTRMIYDGKTDEDNFYTAIVGIGIYNGGGAQFVPHAVPNDGLFAVSYFRNISGWDVVLNTRKFYNGTITKIKQATAVQTEHLRVEPADNADTLLEADGEFLGKAPMEFSMFANALQVIVP